VAAVVASALAATPTLWACRRPSATVTAFLAGSGFALGEAIWLVTTSVRDASTFVAAAADVAIGPLLVWLAARRRPGEQTLHGFGWLGSGAALFWIALLSIRALAP
jgi:hypothetical protein